MELTQRLSCKVCWPSSGFLCPGADSVGTQLWVGLSGCWGEAVQREYLEVSHRKSCHACLRTCTPSEYRYLCRLFLFQIITKCFVPMVPLHLVVYDPDLFPG